MLLLLALAILPIFYFTSPLLRLCGVDAQIAALVGTYTWIVFPGLLFKMQSMAMQEYFKVE